MNRKQNQRLMKKFYEESIKPVDTRIISELHLLEKIHVPAETN